jgi:hypothetical protein
MIIGAGTSGGLTFTEAGTYGGATWGHTHGQTDHVHTSSGLTFTGTTLGTGANTSNTTVRDDKTPADHNAAGDGHGHQYTPQGTIGGNVANGGGASAGLSTTSTTFLPIMTGVVFAIKS